jgi:hypothetical protein
MPVAHEFSPYQRCNGTCVQSQVRHLRADATLYMSLVASIGNHKHMASIGVLKGDMVNLVQFSAGRNCPRSALDRLGVMRVGPILSTTRYLTGFGVNRDQSAAVEGSDVRRSLLIEQKVPSDDTT